jgi:hypothetical protein
MDWVPYEDEDSGFRLEYPNEWIVHEGVPGAALVIVAPEREGGFRPNFNVVVQEMEPTPDLESLTTTHLSNQARWLTDHQLIDVESVELAGVPATRTLSHHRQGIYSLTVEQWLAIGDGGIVVLSATSETLTYSQLADDFAHMVRSFGALG